MRSFTFSSAARVEKCPGSAALPGIEKTTDASERGTAFHAYVRLALEKGADYALALAPEDMREDLAEFDLAGLPSDPASYAAEVAFALNLETEECKWLGNDIHREYDAHGAGADDIVGAADFAAILGLDAVAVDDLKTGYSRHVRAKDHLQLGGLAVAAARCYGRRRARVRLLIRRADGSGYVDTAWLREFDFDGILARLRRADTRAREARAAVAAGQLPELHEGPWCGHCPARWGCPAKVTMVRQLAIAPDSVGLLGGIRDEDLAIVAERLFRAEDVLKSIRAAVDERARERAIDLGGGKEYGLRRVGYTIVDGKIAHRVISAYFAGRGVEEAKKLADAACEFRTSQTAIRDAIRPVAPPRGLKKLEDELKRAIGAAGGLEDKGRWRLDVHDRGALGDGEETGKEEEHGQIHA